MFRMFGSLACAAVLVFTSCSRENEGAAVSGDSAADLTEWQVVGIGSLEPVSGEEGYRFTEGADSKGVTLVSPRPYGKSVTMNFDVRPEQREGVCVVFLSAADSTGRLTVPPDNDGSLGFWSEGPVHDYMIAFHTAYHQPNLFINKNPGMTVIAQTPDVVNEEKWYSMEIGRDGARIWVNVDGRTVLEGVDPEETGLPGGHIGFRLRGPGDGSYSCLLRDVVVREQ